MFWQYSIVTQAVSQGLYERSIALDASWRIPDMRIMHTRPTDALNRLIEGNRRFLADEAPLGEINHDRRMAVAREQRPFAALVGCSDSRVGPETLFGTGLGDLFIVRSAGNTIDQLGLGSLEYAVAVLDVPLIVVMGHERCGAVAAAWDAYASGTMPAGGISAVVTPLLPAVASVVEGQGAQAALSHDHLLEMSARTSIAHTVSALRTSDEAILAGPLSRGELRIVGAYYGLDTGTVDFFDLG